MRASKLQALYQLKLRLLSYHNRRIYIRSMSKRKYCSVASSSGKHSEPEEKMIFLLLPIEMVDEILSHLSYDDLAKLRAVNKFFNALCSQKLNKGFAALEQFHNKCLRSVKSRLPRRESERKNHPLARHSDILLAVETRLSMLNMTFNKYIEAQHCCFIPGKVLDEAFRVLKMVIKHAETLEGPALPRPHDFLQEYRDISSMAMEHFDDKILPAIRERMRTDNRLGLLLKAKQIKPMGAAAAGSLIQQLKAHVGGCQMLVPVYDVNASSKPAHPLTGFRKSKITQRLDAAFDQAEKNRDQPGRQDLTAAYLTKLSKASPNTELESSASGSSTEGQPQPQSPSPLVVRIVQVLKELRAKCTDNERKVIRSHRTFNRNLKSQGLIFQRKINQQRAVIKHLRRELRETRNAMSVMAKDLNRMKQDQSAVSGQASCSNLSTCALFSVSCMPKEEETKSIAQSIKIRGMKRKLEDKPEVPRKR